MLQLKDYESVRDGLKKQPEWMSVFRCDLPESSRGPWTIEQFEVELDLQNLRMMRDGRGCYPGRYTRLAHKTRGVVMSDTTAEIADHFVPYRLARGRVLLHGLGLGCLLKAVLTKSDVAHIDVVEIDPDIIHMVGPHFDDPRVTIHAGDCFTYKWPPNTKWDVVWHDVWDEVTTDNLPQMTKLHRRFGHRSNWQDSWCKSLCQHYRRSHAL